MTQRLSQCNQQIILPYIILSFFHSTVHYSKSDFSESITKNFMTEIRKLMFLQRQGKY